MATKKRHGCLTVWLVIIIAGAVLLTLSYIGIMFGARMLVQTDFPIWFMILQIILVAINVVGAVAIFKWQKWGFFAICGVAVAYIVLNIIVTGQLVISILGGLIVPGILYGVLQIGGENKAWTQLE